MKDYPYVRAWEFMYSNTFDTIDAVLAKARNDKAPYDAVAIENGRWVTFGELGFSVKELVTQAAHQHFDLPEGGINKDTEFEPIPETGDKSASAST